jgi:hypothetical protein
VGLPLTAGAIWMLVDSAPKVHVLPVHSRRAAGRSAPATVAVLPTGVVGTF